MTSSLSLLIVALLFLNSVLQATTSPTEQSETTSVVNQPEKVLPLSLFRVKSIENFPCDDEFVSRVVNDLRRKVTSQLQIHIDNQEFSTITQYEMIVVLNREINLLESSILNL